MDNKCIADKINKLKEEKNAVIVAHYYQNDEVQEIADVVGDSFTLAEHCAKSDKDVIVFCGVHFMAESANILSPDKTVLLPVLDAGCPMADMVDVDGLRKLKQEHPDAAVVSYINTSAAVKAETDICCTSSNAVDVVRSVPQKKIIFTPDQNLATYIEKQVPEKEFVKWPGYCITHHRLVPDDVKKAREAQPDALLLVHPECKNEIVELADFVGSTKQIIDYATKSDATKFIIGTEMGIMYELKKRNPDKQFFLLSQGLICANMKKITIEDVYEALLKMQHKIVVDKEIREKAVKSLERMLACK